MTSNFPLPTNLLSRPKPPRFQSRRKAKLEAMEKSDLFEAEETNWSENRTCLDCEDLATKVNEMSKWLRDLEGRVEQCFETLSREDSSLKETLDDTRHQERKNKKALDQLIHLQDDFDSLHQALEDFKEQWQVTNNNIKEQSRDIKGKASQT